MNLLSFAFLVPAKSFVLRSSSGRSLAIRTASSLSLSKTDAQYLQLAVDHASNGKGHTFPNPAVGCVLVNEASEEILGSGFHPRAGFPHAEVFALFEAANHVKSGVEAAKTVMKRTSKRSAKTENDSDWETVRELASQYASGSPDDDHLCSPQHTLFGGIFAPDKDPVTAFVTLEPCCHYGQTPPCASSLVASGISRVVVGIRDPNPKVNGGGVKLLQDAGIQVDVVKVGSPMHTQCASLVANFFKRISPVEEGNTMSRKDYSWINGSKRRALRKMAGNQKRQGTLNVVSWTGSKNIDVNDNNDEDAIAEFIDSIDLPPSWMEHVDSILWDHELVHLKLLPKKKWAKRLGERIAETLDAHVAQTLGHGVLLYRPGQPAVIDLSKPSNEEE